MSLLAQVVAYLLEWILTLGGRALYEWTTRTVEKNKEKQKEKEALKRYEETKKKGEKSDEMLDRETDILNGN